MNIMILDDERYNYLVKHNLLLDITSKFDYIIIIYNEYFYYIENLYNVYTCDKQYHINDLNEHLYAINRSHFYIDEIKNLLKSGITV